MMTEEGASDMCVWEGKQMQLIFRMTAITKDAYEITLENYDIIVYYVIRKERQRCIYDTKIVYTEPFRKSWSRMGS